MGGRVPYVLETVNKFRSEQDFDKFRADWERTYAEPHRAPILENGLTYKQIGLSAADAQLLETRQFTVAEICRWFSISPHLVGDLSRATFSNIEQLALDFIKFTLTAWLTRWEQELGAASLLLKRRRRAITSSTTSTRSSAATSRAAWPVTPRCSRTASQA
jgi:HK97 family phage portal protein